MTISKTWELLSAQININVLKVKFHAEKKAAYKVCSKLRHVFKKQNPYL